MDAWDIENGTTISEIAMSIFPIVRIVKDTRINSRPSIESSLHLPAHGRSRGVVHLFVTGEIIQDWTLRFVVAVTALGKV